MIPVWLFFFPLPMPATLEETLRKIADAGHVVELAMPPGERLQPPARIAPGAPPLLSFRKIEGQLRHRFGDLDLVVDDAGH